MSVTTNPRLTSRPSLDSLTPVWAGRMPEPGTVTTPVTSRWHTKRITPADLAREAKYRSPAHRAARKQFKAMVEAGIATCWRCGALLHPHAWHVGHDDTHLDIIRGPECVPCNRTAAARKGSAMGHAARRRLEADRVFRRAER